MNSSFKVMLFETVRGEKPVKAFILEQDQTTKAKIYHIIDLLETHGLMLGMPYSKKLHADIYELRIRGKKELRILYTHIETHFYLLHAFKKQTRKTPLKEMHVALNRRAQILD